MLFFCLFRRVRRTLYGLIHVSLSVCRAFWRRLPGIARVIVAKEWELTVRSWWDTLLCNSEKRDHFVQLTLDHINARVTWRRCATMQPRSLLKNVEKLPRINEVNYWYKDTFLLNTDLGRYFCNSDLPDMVWRTPFYVSVLQRVQLSNPVHFSIPFIHDISLMDALKLMRGRINKCWRLQDENCRWSFGPANPCLWNCIGVSSCSRLVNFFGVCDNMKMTVSMRRLPY